MKREIPFYSNLKDGEHCLQASFKMALKYFLPDKDFSFEELDKRSKHKEGKWTWQGAMLLWLAREGFEIVNIENLDYKNFSLYGEEYLKTIWDKETFETQKEYSDLSQEQEIAGELIKDRNILLINKVADIRDLEDLYNKDYAVLVSINPCVLDEKDCYSSHLVIITDINDDYISFHDPGPPPMENRKIKRDLFIKAMTPPRKNDTNIICIKLKK